MHHTVGDWVMQTEWLFGQITDGKELRPPRASSTSLSNSRREGRGYFIGRGT